MWHQSHSIDSFLRQAAITVELQSQHVPQLCPRMNTMQKPWHDILNGKEVQLIKSLWHPGSQMSITTITINGLPVKIGKHHWWHFEKHIHFLYQGTFQTNQAWWYGHRVWLVLVSQKVPSTWVLPSDNLECSFEYQDAAVELKQEMVLNIILWGLLLPTIDCRKNLLVLTEAGICLNLLENSRTNFRKH